MKKAMIFAVILAMMAGTAGCGKDKGGGTSGDVSERPSYSSYPIETTESLTYWMPLDANLSQTVTNFGQTEYAKELEKQTGVKVEYIHPAAGQETEALSVMIASDELTDLVQTSWQGYQGGPTRAIDEDVIICLDDYMDDYAPALKKVLEDNPDADKDVKTDDGRYYVFPLLRLEDIVRCSEGPVLRADWLADLNLEVPETLDEWETVLTAFKDQKNAAAPMSFNWASYNYRFMNMFGADRGEYLKDDQILFGPFQPEYKEALERMHKWYEEGLLDKNIAAVDAKTVDANILNQTTGASLMTGGSGMGKYLDSTDIPGFDLVAAPWPSKEKGKHSSMVFLSARYNAAGSVGISTRCKNPELAVKYLDYNYTEAGHMLANFGIEGVSYTMENGTATYTDVITHDSEGRSMSQVMPMYLRASTAGPFVQDPGYIVQYYAKPQQQRALEVWPLKDENSTIVSVPPVTPSAEESEEFANIRASVDKYISEMNIKYITGVEPMETFDDTFITRLKELNADRMIEIRQASYERYKNR